MSVLHRFRLALPKRWRSLPQNLRGGLKGENAAARYLFWRGYILIDRNFTSGKNEIDIIAKKKNTYIFCEVKTRTLDYRGLQTQNRPAAAVTADKQRHLIAAATVFAERHMREGCDFRFDVIEVYLSKSLRVTHIHHIKNAFMRETFQKR